MSNTNWATPQGLSDVTNAIMDTLIAFKTLSDEYIIDKDKIETLQIEIDTKTELRRVEETKITENIMLHEEELKTIYGKMNDTVRKMEFDKKKYTNSTYQKLDADIQMCNLNKQGLDKLQSIRWMKIDYLKSKLQSLSTVSSNIRFFLQKAFELEIVDKVENPAEHVGA